MKISDKIDKNIPIKGINKRTIKYYEENVAFINILNKLKIKDSFVIELDHNIKEEKGKIKSWVGKYRKEQNSKISIRTIGKNTLRIWRVK